MKTKEIFDLGRAVQLLCEMYPNDMWKPNVLVAWVPGRQQFYAAVHRYEVPHYSNCQVIARAYAPTATQAMVDALYELVKPDPVLAAKAELTSLFKADR
jgi:hypothetical protein